MKQDGLPWKQDGFPWKLARIYIKTRCIHGNKMNPWKLEGFSWK